MEAELFIRITKPSLANIATKKLEFVINVWELGTTKKKERHANVLIRNIECNQY